MDYRLPSSLVSTRSGLNKICRGLDERIKRMKTRSKELKNKETLKFFLEFLDDHEINNLQQLDVYREIYLQLLKEKDYCNSRRILDKLANFYTTSHIHYMAKRVEQLHTELCELYPFHELMEAYDDEEWCFQG
jgi:hypothetical protein